MEQHQKNSRIREMSWHKGSETGWWRTRKLQVWTLSLFWDLAGRGHGQTPISIYYTLTSAPWAFKTQMVDKNHLGKTAVQLTEWLRSHRSPHSDHTQPTLGTLLQEHLLKCRQTINYYNKWVTEQRGPSVALSQMVELQRRGPGHCQSNSLGTWNIIVRLLKTKYINIHRIK